jgi:histidyl-tRNA synthetase
MGDLVISLVLKKFGALPPDLSASPAKVLVTVFDKSTIAGSFEIAARLREAGINTAVYPEPARLSAQFKSGDRMGFKIGIILGPDEQAQGTATIKDLRTGEQKLAAQAGLVDIIRQLLR